MSRHKAASSLSLINYITGISDGLLLPVVPCALLLLSGASSEAFLWCNIAAFMGALAYGLARFLGERQEIKHHHPGFAKEELPQDEKLLKHIGIDENLVSDIMEQVGQEQELWLQEIRENDMDWEAYDPKRALKSGLQTGLGFLAGTYIGLLPFLVLYNNISHIVIFLFTELCLLFAFGWLKGRYVYNNPLRYGILQVLLGVLLFLVLGMVICFMPGWFA